MSTASSHGSGVRAIVGVSFIHAQKRFSLF